MEQGDKKTSAKIIAARMALAQKIIDLMEREAPCDEELHYEALMLAFHASTNTDHCRELFRPG